MSWRRYAVVTLLFTLAAIAWLAPVVAQLDRSVLGGPADATSSIRDYWAMEQQGRNPFTFGRDKLLGAPEGLEVASAITYANPVQPSFVWTAKEVAGFVGAWNLFLLVGLVLAGVSMFVLLDRLGLSFLPSLFGAYVWAFNAWILEKAFVGHAGLAQTWIFPVLVLALVRLRRERTLAAAAVVGAVVALAWYLNVYFGLFALFVLGVFLVVDAVTVRDWTTRLWVSTTATVALGTAVVLLAPAAFALLTSADESGIVAHRRPIDDLQLYGAAPLAYLVPSERHPLVGDAVAGLWSPSDSRHFAEPTLFFGYTTMLLAASAILLALRRRHAPLRGSSRWPFVVVFAAALVPVAFVTSLPRLVDVLGVDVPAPAYVIGEITTYFRVFARFGLLVGLGLVILAAFALEWLVRRQRGAWLAGALLALVAIELAPRAPVQTWSTDRPPEHVSWLAEHPGGIVANYPMLTDKPDEDRMETAEYYYQVLHGHPLYGLYGIYGAALRESREGAVRALTKYPADEVTPGVLAAARVRYVVRHDAVYRAIGERPPRLRRGLGFTPVARLRDTTIFELDTTPAVIESALQENAGKVAAALGVLPPELRYGDEGFYPPELRFGAQWRWLKASGKLEVDNLNTPSVWRFQLETEAFSALRSRRLNLLGPRGELLGSARVLQTETHVTLGPFSLPTGRITLRLQTVPGPERLAPTDRRRATVYLAPLALRPVPDVRRWRSPREARPSGRATRSASSVATQP